MHPTLDRLETERKFHDRQAAERAVSFRAGSVHLRFDIEQYLDHESWIRPAFHALGTLRGQRVLDLGCGHGMMAVTMAKCGAIVNAVDLSSGYVEETRKRAVVNGVQVSASVANAEQLPFDEGSFDAVWGNAILHHLDLAVVGRELKRVLKPGGIAVFCEPWGGNPLLRLARCWLPYPGKHRTPDESPLLPSDVALLRDQLPTLQIRGFQLLGALRRLHPAFRVLDRVDRVFLKSCPRLEKFGRYVVLTLQND